MYLGKLKEQQDMTINQNVQKDIFSYIRNKLCTNGLRTALPTNKKRFILCESCFWCASSYVDFDKKMNISTEKCPLCQNGRIESLPISDNEIYRFDYGLKRVSTLEFLPINTDV
jgi:hypothetical protein